MSPIFYYLAGSSVVAGAAFIAALVYDAVTWSPPPKRVATKDDGHEQ